MSQRTFGLARPMERACSDIHPMLLLRADPGIFMRAVAENKLHQVSTLPKMKVLTCVEACHGLRSKDSESFHVHCSSEKNGPCSD